eukprot:scaffold101668_cov37-Tisochrysis_lutea.AAC.1
MHALRRTASLQPRVSRVAARAWTRVTTPHPQGTALFHATRTPAEGATFHHVKDPNNSADTPFEFDEESEKEIAFTLSKYPDTPQGRQSAIMPMLWIVQQQLDKAHAAIKAENPRGAMPFPKSQGGGGWVPLAAMHKVRTCSCRRTHVRHRSRIRQALSLSELLTIPPSCTPHR